MSQQMQYKVTIDFSYDLESEKSYEEIQINLEQELNALTRDVVLTRRQIRLKKLKDVKDKIRLATLAPEELFNQIGEGDKTQEFKIEGKTYTVRMNSQRYFVFKNNASCIACGIKGTKAILEMNECENAPHFNLYAEENGKLILMTKDHILPKSKGGKNEIVNYQTMCAICNNLKGNDESLNNENIKELRIFYNENKNLPRRMFRELLDLKRSAMGKNYIKKGKKEMKKTKSIERLEKIKKEADKVVLMACTVADENLTSTVASLVKVIDEILTECNNETSAAAKIDETDSGRWQIVSLTADGKCAGFLEFNNGKSQIAKDIKYATEFISKKEAQRICDQLGPTYSVIGYPRKR